MGCFACFDGGSKQQRKEEERLASQEARAKAAEAAQKRQEQFEHSAAGRAAKAQLAAASKQSNNNSKGEPVLKNLEMILRVHSLLAHYVNAVADQTNFVADGMMTTLYLSAFNSTIILKNNNGLINPSPE
ncbi:hypothetical protein Adt_21363 [Abeliophyllum distichum]|uniref:Uncharacterized protein n=1 Tax=Abeliophyllum distichum TaxID=126358 RepID=A0ABD1SZ62_9LAMI